MVDFARPQQNSDNTSKGNSQWIKIDYPNAWWLQGVIDPIKSAVVAQSKERVAWQLQQRLDSSTRNPSHHIFRKSVKILEVLLGIAIIGLLLFCVLLAEICIIGRKLFCHAITQSIKFRNKVLCRKQVEKDIFHRSRCEKTLSDPDHCHRQATNSY